MQDFNKVIEQLESAIINGKGIDKKLDLLKIREALMSAEYYKTKWQEELTR